MVLVSRCRATINAVLVLGTASIILSLPMLVRGPMPAGHDTYEHLNFSRHFAEQFWAGELYPRWLVDMNHGLGSPSFFVYPPFPSYVFALLQPLGKLFHFNAFNVGELLCLAASGIFAFLWLSTMASRRVSLVVAVLYMLVPYHLSVDYYRRSALSESWALAWMPLLLYCMVQIVRRRRNSVVGFGVAYALMILSHLISVLIFSPIPLLLSLLIAEPRKKMLAVISVVLGCCLGAGLAAVYLVPALSESKPFMYLGILVSSNFLAFGRGLITGSSTTRFLWAVSAVTVDTIVLIAFCGIAALRDSHSMRKKQVLFWLAVCVVPVFMMSRVSWRVWNAFPFLGNAVQFPWRLDIILCVAVLPVAAFFLSDLSWRLSLRDMASLAVVILLVGSWVASYVITLKRYSLPAAISPTVNESDGWFGAWTTPGLDQSVALEESKGPQVRFLAGDGTATVTRWAARHVELRTNCSTCGPVMVKQFYFPAWRAELLPEDRPLDVRPALPSGLIEVQVPPGTHQIDIDIPRSRAERVGSWISAWSVLVCIACCAISLVHTPEKSSALRESWESGT